MSIRVLSGVAVILGCVAIAAAPGAAADEPIVLNDNGGWCWFEDQRALVHGGKLIIGSVADRGGTGGEERDGNIEVTTYDLATGNAVVSILHPHLGGDDHNSPALVVCPDGRFLAMYAKHGPENRMYYRLSARASDSTSWEPEQVFAPSERSRVTYSNLHLLMAENGGRGRLYDFYRGLDSSWKPSWMISDDGGRTWESGGLLMTFTDPANPGRRHRPYVKYASNARGTIHFVATEAHPAAYTGTSIYHGFICGGYVFRSDGRPIRALRDGPVEPAEMTRIFRGDAAGWAWTSDLELDAQGHPYVGYTVHKTDDDHRYRYARWDGARWHDYEIAYAGRRLYERQEHYTGLIALDPNDPSTVYISTDADPETGAPLISAADGQRHYEIFEGVTGDGGATWRWTAITEDSTADNLRPIVPSWDVSHTALLWLRGTYRRYTDYDLDVVGLILSQ
ncbi:MAG: BNR-4 repeat-containing protein [Armatimonadota bacterium]